MSVSKSPCGRVFSGLGLFPVAVQKYTCRIFVPTGAFQYILGPSSVACSILPRPAAISRVLIERFISFLDIVLNETAHRLLGLTQSELPN
jgi:hypothetical protein